MRLIPPWAQAIVDWAKQAIIGINAYEIKLCEEGKMLMFKVTDRGVTFSMGIRSEDDWLYSIFAVVPGSGAELASHINVRLIDLEKEVRSVYEEASAVAALAAAAAVKA